MMDSTERAELYAQHVALVEMLMFVNEMYPDVIVGLQRKTINGKALRGTDSWLPVDRRLLQEKLTELLKEVG